MLHWHGHIRNALSRFAGQVAAILMVIVVLFAATPRALAQVNLLQGNASDPYNELDTETIASRELGRDYYIQKQNGASTVSDQSRDFASPDGVRAGMFFMYPSVNITSTFDDNIFRSARSPESDLRTVVAPGVRVKSNLPRHALDMSLSGRIVTFLENSDQNYEDYTARLSGALHFDHAHTISASLISRLAHEERGDLTAPLAAAEPVPVYHNRASFGITRDVGRLYGTLSGHVERFDFKDVTASDGSHLDQDYRDTDTYGVQLKTGYRISPGFEVLGAVSAKRIQNSGQGIWDFDGNNFDIRGGVGFEVGPLLNFEVLAGVGQRDYDDPNKETLTTSVFGGQVEWLPTRRMTVRGKASRYIADSPDADGGTYITSHVGIEADYEIYHNIIAHGGLGFASSEFTYSDREDDTFSASLGIEYLMSKNVHLSAGYQYLQNDSTLADRDTTNNRFTVGAKIQF